MKLPNVKAANKQKNGNLKRFSFLRIQIIVSNLKFLPYTKEVSKSK